MLKINGTQVKEPSKLRFIISDIDGDAYRDKTGAMHRDRLAVKRKLELSWPALTQSELSTLLNAVTNAQFSVYYLDGALGYTTKTFYVGDRTAPVYSYKNGLPTWEGLTMNFIEV